MKMQISAAVKQIVHGGGGGEIVRGKKKIDGTKEKEAAVTHAHLEHVHAWLTPVSVVVNCEHCEHSGWL